jgi:hypothetical protein
MRSDHFRGSDWSTYLVGSESATRGEGPNRWWGNIVWCSCRGLSARVVERDDAVSLLRHLSCDFFIRKKKIKNKKERENHWYWQPTFFVILWSVIVQSIL